MIARASPTARALTFWVLASALALATHYFAALAIVPEAIWLLTARRGRRAVRVAVAIVAVCGLALIPLAVSQNGTAHDSWIASTPLGLRLRQIVPQFLIGTGAPARIVLRDAAIALVAIAVARLALDGRAPERSPALVAAGLGLAGFALSLALVVVGFDDLITRNVLALWLPAALLTAAALAAWRGHAVGVIVAAALCAIGITAAVGVAAERSLQRPDCATSPGRWTLRPLRGVGSPGAPSSSSTTAPRCRCRSTCRGCGCCRRRELA
ncbi:MAG: hypothetical protein ACXVSE_04510 [Solirubrobacteraceae bacterium]